MAKVSKHLSKRKPPYREKIGGEQRPSWRPYNEKLIGEPPYNRSLHDALVRISFKYERMFVTAVDDDKLNARDVWDEYESPDGKAIKVFGDGCVFGDPVSRHLAGPED